MLTFLHTSFHFHLFCVCSRKEENHTLYRTDVLIIMQTNISYRACFLIYGNQERERVQKKIINHFFCSLAKVNYFSFVNCMNIEDKYIVAACRDMPQGFSQLTAIYRVAKLISSAFI